MQPVMNPAGGYPGAFQSPPAPMSPGGGYPPQQQGGYPQPGFPGGPAAMPMVPMQQPMMQPMMAAPAAPGLPMQQVMQPMMQPVAMVPPGYALVPAGSVVQQLVGNDLLSAIGGLKGLFISQEVSLTEVLTGCDTQNKYGATAWNPALGAERPKDGKYGEQLFKFKERSNCLMRQVCGPRREFNMAFFADTPRIASHRQGGEPLTYPDAIVLERPFKCTCVCFNRSVIRVKHNTLGYLGEVYNPWECLDTVFHVRPPTPGEGMTAPIAEAVKGSPVGKPWYIVRGSLCQWGMWFPPLPCGPCSRIVFNIFDGNDVACTKPIGSIAKVWSGLLQEMFTVADNYSVEFPADAGPVQKALLAATVMLIDFLMFETKEKNNNGTSIIEFSA